MVYLAAILITWLFFSSWVVLLVIGAVVTGFVFIKGE